MIRYGASAQEMQPIPAREIFILRLNLLIIMSKAFLKGNPLGEFRKKSIIDTARFIFSAARSQDRQLGPAANEDLPTSDLEGCNIHADQIFLQRTQLLAIMANAFVIGKATGHQRKRAMSKNIDLICDHLSSRQTLANSKILKVA